MKDRRLIRELKAALIEDLKRQAEIRSKPVENAFRAVDRHRLIESYYREDSHGDLEFDGLRYRHEELDARSPQALETIYSDQPLLIRISPPSSSSQPGLVARMLEALELKQGMNVLEIGTGTGYHAALIQHITGGQVTSVEIQEDVARQANRLLQAAGYGQVQGIASDGSLGYPPNAPYDRIVATAGCPDLSPHWPEQLADDGFMLVPLQHGEEAFDPLVKIWKEGDVLAGKFVGFSGFMTVQGGLETDQRVSVDDQLRLHSLETASTYPLPDPLSDRRKKREFLLFLAIKDQPVSWNGLYGDKGAVLLLDREGEIAVKGDTSHYQTFEAGFDEWRELGQPGLVDWRLEFSMQGRPIDGVHADRTWYLARKFTIQTIRLRGSP